MERNAYFAAILTLSAGLFGCSGGGSTPGESTAAAPANGPDQAVHQFLESVRLGNDAGAQTMLTELARKKTEEMDMVVAPPGSDTARFEVGAVQMATDGTAQVDSVWSDLDPDGKRRTDQIRWILRQETPGQWRIAGMATKIFPDQGPVVLNFENPQEMLDRQRQAEEEANRRATVEQAQATKAQDPFKTERQ